MQITVAIDGPAAAGKGTLSKAVAAHFGFAHLDTGLLYRATGRRVLNGERAVDAARGLLPEDLQGDDLRTPDVAQAASRVAADPAVRRALVDFQRAFARRAGGAVLDGRDIGTVICPEAEVKLYVTASDNIRARRRFEELSAKGHEITFAEVLRDLQARDARDAARAAAPMKPAEDAVLLDTSEMDIPTAVARAIDLIDTVIAK
ncbi:MAG: (d)CMP kinase [Pseudomonadota bacterium]